MCLSLDAGLICANISPKPVGLASMVSSVSTSGLKYAVTGALGKACLSWVKAWLVLLVHSQG